MTLWAVGAAAAAAANCRADGMDITPVEDVKVGAALNKSGVAPLPTEDGASQRFHLFAPEFYLSFDPDKEPDGWVTQGEKRLSPGFVKGAAGISRESIAFHYCDARCIRELGKLLYTCK